MEIVDDFWQKSLKRLALLFFLLLSSGLEIDKIAGSPTEFESWADLGNGSHAQQIIKKKELDPLHWIHSYLTSFYDRNKKHLSYLSHCYFGVFCSHLVHLQRAILLLLLFPLVTNTGTTKKYWLNITICNPPKLDKNIVSYKKIDISDYIKI